MTPSAEILRGIRAGLVVAFACAFAALFAAPANADYAPLDPCPTGGLTVGVAVNQTSGDLYGANVVDPGFGPGQVVRFSDGCTAETPFGTGNPSGVAVNPTNSQVYAIQTDLLEIGATPDIKTYPATGGASTGAFAVDYGGNTFPMLATDAAGSVYYPNEVDDSVEKFSSAGALEDTYTNTMTDPTSVAVDSDGNVYVVDADSGGRVMKFNPDGSSVANFTTTGGPVSVAVNLADDTVFVGKGSGSAFHIVQYSSTGTELDDFGAGEFSDALLPVGNGLAVDADTGTVFAADAGGNEIERFSAAAAPSVDILPPTNVDNDSATLHGEVNPNGDAITECEFEYVTAAEHAETEFDSPDTIPCEQDPGSGTAPVPVSANVTGLAENTVYHYRLVATNSVDSATSTSTTFKTAATCATDPSKCPPPPKECPEDPSKCPPPKECPEDPSKCPPPIGTLDLASASAAFKSGKASVKVKCSGGACKSGPLTLTAKIKSGKKKKAKNVTIGTATVSVLADGATATIKVSLNGKAKSVLAKTGKLAATVSGAVTGKVTIKGGKKPKKKKKKK